MPRHVRIEYTGAIHHVLNRGNRREPIFGDGAHRMRFLETLGERTPTTIGWAAAVCKRLATGSSTVSCESVPKKDSSFPIVSVAN